MHTDTRYATLDPRGSVEESPRIAVQDIPAPPRGAPEMGSEHDDEVPVVHDN